MSDSPPDEPPASMSSRAPRLRQEPFDERSARVGSSVRRPRHVGSRARRLQHGLTTVVTERQDKIMGCTHAVRELPQRAAGYDCENNATVREGQGTTARTTPPFVKGRVRLRETTPLLRDGQKPWSGHPSCGRTADYLPFGDCSGILSPGQWWNERKGGDPRTEQVTKGADSELPGWQPKERRPFCSLSPKSGTLEPAWVVSVHRRGGDPRTLASRRRWLLQVVAATTGGRAAVVVAIVSRRFPSSSSLPAFLNNFVALREASFL